MLKRITLSRQAYEVISGKIISGRLEAGTRLTEEGLCREFQISRTPVRDALLRLFQEGLVEPLPARGYRVKSFTEESVKALFECRALLECEALRQGFKQISRRKLQKIRDRLIQNEENESGRRHELLHTDAALHQLIAESCPNSYIQEILYRLFRQCDAFRQYRTLSGKEDIDGLTQERLEIVNAILDEQSQKAEKLLRSHILRGAAASY